MESCAYCGQPTQAGTPEAHCTVCGMAIGRGHGVHVILVQPETPPIHFCSLGCMDNYDFLKAEAPDG